MLDLEVNTCSAAIIIIPIGRHNVRIKINILILISSIFIYNQVHARSDIASRQKCQSVSKQTCDIAHSLGRGVNMGNMLESPREGDWGLRLDPAYIDAAKGKFNTIRLPVRWSNHASPTADATLDDFFLTRVSKAIDYMLSNDFYVIVNMHHYSQLFGDKLQANEFSVKPELLEMRFINIWKQLALHFKDRPPKLIFELLNEPHDRMQGESWNKLAAGALAAVRESNPTRTVFIGPGDYNNIRALSKLKVPSDKNIVISIHNYDPFPFTHQGASWLPFKLPIGVTCCTAQHRQIIIEAFDIAADWNSKYGYPLHLGEFGSLQSADLNSREMYTRFVRDTAEARGIAWTYWEFGAIFGVYSPEKHSWIEPIRRALLD